MYLTFVNPMVKISNKSKTAKVTGIKNKFMLTEGRVPTSEEIINELQKEHGIEIVNEQDIYDVIVTSIDSPHITENSDDFASFFVLNDGCNSDRFTHNNNFGSSEASEANYSKVLISNSLGALTEKERKVVEMLYGIGDNHEHEVQEVADIIGITKEGVRVINRRALEKLRDEINIIKETI
jgi:RNA polymerase sigma factor (sigma-70 family)